MEHVFQHHFKGSCTDVFEQLNDYRPQSVKASRFGELIEVQQIKGTDAQAGASYDFRFNYGSFDLWASVTITTAERPFKLCYRFQPLEFWVYNPAERLGEEPLLSAEGAFKLMFGKHPSTIFFDWDLTTEDGLCLAKLTLNVEVAKPLGWMGKRRWAKSAAQLAQNSFDAIESGLAYRAD